ncbi:16S rRNA (cytosine(1402)-N(4))-methyltransferase RsmH [Bartonella tamiae]|uniref:16S rRNA (cytosine(1402)-N(4))-methyltransferase RsmH n=1 Tax=Bartonella tamiae TaxID=373638 RepID=UPI003CC90CC0
MSDLDKNHLPHVPVLLRQVVESLAPLEGATIIDGTFGAGGYTRAFLEKGANVIALDRDPNAICDGAKLVQHYAPRLRLVETEFSHLDDVVCKKVDGIILDIGVSSMQIDTPERGFSFQKDGPLDMRMAQKGVSAADIVNTMKRTDLTRIFGILGEERQAGRISGMIERRRNKRPFLTTQDLANAIEALVGRKPGERIHPATRVFQALRIYVNDELGQLAKALFAAERALVAGGRLGVVTFHSLEDRMVKQFFSNRSGVQKLSRHMPEVTKREPSFVPLFKGAIQADEKEIDENARARSARLRVGVRTAMPAFDNDMTLFGLANFVNIDTFKTAFDDTQSRFYGERK